MFGEKKKFDMYVAGQPIEAYNVYGDEFSIKLKMDEIQQKGLSRILGKYVNEQKAYVNGEFAYIMPEYDTYHIRKQNYKKQKLLQYVSQKTFLSLLNQADICIEWDNTKEKQTKNFFFKVAQDSIRKYQCMPVVALLIDAGLAHIGENDNKLYIICNYQDKLERNSKIQTDLSHFRTILGESNNLAALIALIEAGKMVDTKVKIKESDVSEEEMRVEMMCLIDLGLANYFEGNDCDDDNGYEIDVNFASWLLEYISTTSDRISFGNMYEG